jgi:membrane protein implicated in regulation of membrane protease activity
MSDLPMSPEWLWLIGGVLLLIAEIVAPGFFLMFVGVAAIATGLLALVLPIGVPVQLGLFAVLAIAITRVWGRRAYAARYDHSSDPLLNDPANRLVGRVVTVVESVDARGGRVRLGDSVWSARGEPAEPGDKVRIIDVEGNCLRVEPEHKLPPPA